MIQHGQGRSTGTGLGIASRKDEAYDTRMQKGPGAHGTRFERADQGASGKSVVVQELACVSQGDDLGVGGRIGGSEHLVVASTDDGAGGRNYEGTDGNLASDFGGQRFRDRETHQGFVVQACGRRI